MKKMLALLFALIMVISLIPMNAMALRLPAGKFPDISDVPVQEGKPDLTTKEEESKNELVGKLENIGKLKIVCKNEPVYYHPANEHEFGYASNAKYHWLQCPCGCKISMEPHVDPLDTTDDYCFCGYHFSDNAELVTLWLQDCKELKNFRKNVYEYETDAYTYKEVNELKRIATRTFDSEATVELPEELTLKEGENKIEIKVTAENKKVSQIYTVIVNKEAKK